MTLVLTCGHVARRGVCHATPQPTNISHCTHMTTVHDWTDAGWNRGWLTPMLAETLRTQIRNTALVEACESPRPHLSLSMRGPAHLPSIFAKKACASPVHFAGLAKSSARAVHVKFVAVWRHPELPNP